MPEVKSEIKQIEIAYVCDDCGQGSMILCGSIKWLHNPVLYPSRCDKCGYETELTAMYPRKDTLIVTIKE